MLSKRINKLKQFLKHDIWTLPYDGLSAVKWWREGKIEEVKQYCLDDVRITKELYDYAMKNGKLAFKEGREVKEFKLDTTDWEKPSENKLTFSMPF